MRLAISNIAWDASEDVELAALLDRYQLDAIDIAPAKYFSRPAEATDAEILQVRRRWEARGVEITGMQALLFGTSGLNMFGEPEMRLAMLEHLRAVCHIGGVLGAPRLVFGSPKCRDRAALGDAETASIAVDFFGQLGAVAAEEGVTVCLEPNPPRYGANFMTRADDTAAVVSAVGHPAIRMQLDTGAIAINAESATAVIAAHGDLIGHIHASEPDLVPLGDGTADHAEAAAAIGARWPDMLVSIEMLATSQEPHLVSIERAIRTAGRYYRAGSTHAAR